MTIPPQERANTSTSSEVLRGELRRCQQELAGCQVRMEELEQAETTLAAENRILELIAKGEPLASVLEELCLIVEEICDGSLCSILLLDASGERLQHGAAPSLPAAYISAFGGSAIGPEAGPCGRAVYHKAPIIVVDIANDLMGDEYRTLALAHGLLACWSTPIFSSDGKALGSFAMLAREPCSPTTHHQTIISQITHLASIGIERKQSAEALNGSETLARGQVEALTRTLDTLATESDPNRLLGHILGAITEQFGAHSSSVWRRDEANDKVGFEGAFEDGNIVPNTDPRFAGIDLWLPMEDFWPWPEVFRTGKPSLIEDIRTVPQFALRDRLLPLGIVTVLLVPLFVTGRLEGAIGLRFTHKRQFREEEVALAQALANQATLVMQLTRLSAVSRESAVIAERYRMARDIHDTLAQGLTGVIVQLEAAADASSRGLDIETMNHIDRAGHLARESLNETRRSVQALRPQALERKNLCEALDDLVLNSAPNRQFKPNFTVTGQSQELPLNWDENLLRISQEVVTNALRHAHASVFDACVTFAAKEFRLEFRDNGIGFDMAAKHDGFGIIGIRERVEVMGGQLTIESAAEQGTSILIVLPYANDGLHLRT
jgi:signal transduction histidine kinase